MVMRTLRVLPWILGVSLAAQAEQKAVASLLDRAIAKAQTKLTRDLDIWEDHSTWETAWRVQSKNYEVRRLGSYAKAKGLVDFMQRKLDVIESTLGFDLPPGGERMKVFVLPTLGVYRKFGDDHGEEHSSLYGSFYAKSHPERPVALLEDSDWARQFAVHSAVHQFLDRAFPGREIPLWIDEGLAAYFSMCQSADLGWARTQFLSWRQDDAAFIPLRRLIGDPIAQYAGEQPVRRWIELGMMFWYLFEVRGDARTRSEDVAPFRDFLVLLLRGQNSGAHELNWIVAGGEDRDDLERELRTEDLRQF